MAEVRTRHGAEPSRGVALITGAGQRVGRTIAIELAINGWDIAIHYHDSEADALEVLREVVAFGRRACTIAADLSDPDEISGLLPSCIEALGAPTCLVNNASVFLHDDVASLTAVQWQHHMAVNLQAPVFLAQAFAHELAAHRPECMHGAIINIIDQRVWKPTPGFFSYGVSKAGLWSATRMLAQGLAPRIRVNAIGPGPVLPSAHQSAEQFAGQCAATPLQRGTTPQEIADAIRFILDAPAMTGQMIALDGGQHLAWKTPDVELDA